MISAKQQRRPPQAVASPKEASESKQNCQKSSLSELWKPGSFTGTKQMLNQEKGNLKTGGKLWSSLHALAHPLMHSGS